MRTRMAATRLVYGFGDFRLDAGKRLLIGSDGKAVPLTAKPYETLAYLVEHTGSVISKDELMQAVWPGTAVEENNLTQNISLLRRTLGEESGEHRFISTIPGRGYQFIPSVSIAPAKAAASLPDTKTAIAVLPFVNVTADPAYDYFGDGL